MMKERTAWLASLLLLIATSPPACTERKSNERQLSEAEVYLANGVEHSKASRHKEAIETLQRALTLNPKNAEAHYYLGDACFGLKRHKEAVAAYQEAIKLKPDYSAAYHHLGKLHLALGKPGEAIGPLQETIQRAPGDASARYDLAVAYLESGNRNAALEQQMILYTINREPASKLSRLMFKSGKPVAGIAFTSKMIDSPEAEYMQTDGPVPAQGEVAVVVTIDESGKVISAHALSGHPALRAPSVAAALQARFEPLVVDDQPAKVTGVMTYEFTPGEKSRPKPPSHVMQP